MDWTNPNLADWRYVDALVQAVNERLSVIGQDLLIFPDYSERYLNISILQQIHAKVISLIPQYINHEDNSGDWNGKASIPLWSFNSIMSSITGNVYQLNSGLSCKSDTVKQWAIFTYKILNKLRWINKTSFEFILPENPIYNRCWQSWTQNPDYSVTLSEAYTIAKNSISTPQPNGSPNSGFLGVDIDLHQALLGQICTIIIKYNGVIKTTDTHAFKFLCGIDFYAIKGNSVNWGDDYFSSTNGNLVKMFSDKPYEHIFNVFDFFEPSISSDFSLFPPLVQDEGIIKVYYGTFSFSAPCSILKFDTSGGFAFKDW
jgi:hypothetical protein